MNSIVISLVLMLIPGSMCINCDSIPRNVTKPKQNNEMNKYQIYLHGNPKGYIPDQKYKVFLSATYGQPVFKKFTITSETANNIVLDVPTGHFEIEEGHEIFSKFSTNCPNTVIESNLVPKTEISLYWIAPPKGSGCIALKATVLVSEDQWYSENGLLTRVFCEETSLDENVEPEHLRQCCACSEAKYEVAFEGRWTRNTHPKNYPSDWWSTRFSDIIGASHSSLYEFWGEQEYASEGMKDLAETGNTTEVEAEIKKNSHFVRTIIKARGLQYPNITQTSYAVFRVDSKNHRVSLVAKIIPSPDWIVGVSNFELCELNGSWTESYTYNLYPYDVGIDDGIDYLSSKPLLRNKPIRTIPPSNPSDPQSPFFNEDGEMMNPIAKLHFRRQRLYDENCEIDKSCNEMEDIGGERTNEGDEEEEREEPEDDEPRERRWGKWRKH